MTHMQNPPTQNWPAFVPLLPAGSMLKWVDGVQNLEEASRYNSDLVLNLRHWYDEGQVFGDSTNWVDYVDAARRFFAAFVDGTFDRYAHIVDTVEGWNEYNAWSHTPHEVAVRVAVTEAQARIWRTEYRNRAKYAHIRLIIGNVAVGNDLPLDYARIAYQNDAILGYHSYFPVRKPGTAAPEALEPVQVHDGARMRAGLHYAPPAGYDGRQAQPETAGDPYILAGEWPYYSGRWAEMDRRFVAAGYRCDWAFTEAGEVGYGVNPGGGVFLRAFDGWKHPTVYGGDVEALKAGIRYWLDHATATPAWKEGRIVGGFGAVFTSSSNPSSWTTFDKPAPVLGEIAQLLAAYQPPQPPQPPPDPEPEPRRYAREYWLLPQDATLDQVLKVTEEAYRTRSTVGFSADDAFVAPEEVTRRRVKVYNAERIGGSREDLLRWAETHFGRENLIVEFEELPAEPARPFRWEAWPTEWSGPGLIPGTNLNQAFGARPEVYEKYGLPGHEGIDFHLRTGERVFAIAPGTVYQVDREGKGNYGIHVRIQHSDGFKSVYAHLSQAMVKVGDQVEAGEPIGLGGSTGKSSGPHLHLTMKNAALATYPRDIIDPTPFMEEFLWRTNKD